MDANLGALVTGVIGSVMLTISAAPQAWRAWRKGTAGLSYAGSVAVTSVDLAWASWALASGALIPFIADSFGSVISVFIVFVIARDRDISKWSTGAWVALLLTAAVGLGWWDPLAAGLFAFTMSFAWRTFQLVAIMRSPSILGVSLSLWVINFFAVGIWSIHGIFIENLFLVVSSGILSVYGLVVAVVVATKRKRLALTGKA